MANEVCITYEFNTDEEFWDLDTGSTGTNGQYGETWNPNNGGDISCSVELQNDLNSTFTGSIFTNKDKTGSPLTWAAIGVPIGALVYEVSIQFEYSVLIREETQVVRVGRFDLLTAAGGEVIINPLQLVPFSDFEYEVQSQFTKAASGFVVLPEKELWSDNFDLQLFYSIGQQTTISVVDFIYYDNIKVCAKYTSTVESSGRTTMDATLTGIVDADCEWNGSTGMLKYSMNLLGFILMTENISGSTSAIFIQSALSEALLNASGLTNSQKLLLGKIINIELNASGSTTANITAGSRGLLAMLADGVTDVQNLSLLGKTVLDLLISGSTDVNALLLEGISDVLELNLSGETISNLTATSIAESTINLTGSTDKVALILNGFGEASLNADGSTIVTSLLSTSTGDIDFTSSGSTDVSVLVLSGGAVLSTTLSGETNVQSLLAISTGEIDLTASGSTTVISSILKGFGNLNLPLSGSTTSSIDGVTLINGDLNVYGSTNAQITILANGEIDLSLTGSTNFFGEMEDATGGIRNILLSVYGETLSNINAFSVGDTSFTLTGETNVQSFVLDGIGEVDILLSGSTLSSLDGITDINGLLTVFGNTTSQVTISANANIGFSSTGSTSFFGEAEDATGGIRNIILSAHGDTTSNITISSIGEIDSTLLGRTNISSLLLDGLGVVELQTSGSTLSSINGVTDINGTLTVSGSTISQIEISANSKTSLNVVGSTSFFGEMEDATGGVRNIRLIVDGDTLSNITISSIGEIDLSLSGETVQQSLIATSTIEAALTNLSGSTLSNIDIAAISKMSLTLNGSTLFSGDLIDATGGVRPISMNASGHTLSSMNGEALNPILLTNIFGDTTAFKLLTTATDVSPILTLSGSTTAVFNGGAINPIDINMFGETESFKLLGTTTNKIALIDISGETIATKIFLSSESSTILQMSGSTDNQKMLLTSTYSAEMTNIFGETISSFNAISDGVLSANWSGSTDVDILISTGSGSMTATTWEGKTLSSFNIIDANENVRDISVNWNGKTNVDTIEIEAIAEISMSCSGHTNNRKMKICCFDYWQVGSVKVQPELCEAYIDGVRVW